jgi:hypothetical protein
MINFILKLKHLPEKYMMNSVLENFTILQVSLHFFLHIITQVFKSNPLGRYLLQSTGTPRKYKNISPRHRGENMKRRREILIKCEKKRGK